MSIEVIQPGVLSTLQDQGRHGFQHLGILVDGAMDIVAHRIANMLISNRPDAATLEMTLQGPHLKFSRDTLIAITGSEMAAKVNGKPIPLWHPVYIQAGAELEFEYAKQGCRAYLAVEGGFTAPPILGSRSTYLKGGFGGHQGRALIRGDKLTIHEEDKPHFSWLLNMLHASKNAAFWSPWGIRRHEIESWIIPNIIRVLPGQDTDRFSNEAKNQFFTHPFKLSSQVDRMGYRLEGPSIDTFEIISEAIAFGSIQIPPNGKPIILMADHQTTGGYPCIGVVATVDLPQLAQMCPGQTFRFQPIDTETAEHLLIEREYTLRKMESYLRCRLNDRSP